MVRLITLGLLLSYFFIFIVNTLSLAYDRYIVQFLGLAVINIAAFILILRKYSFVNVISSLKNVKPLLFYSGFIILSAVSIFVAENQVESIITFSQYLTFFFSLLFIYILSKQSKIKFDVLLINLSLFSIFLESTYILLIFFDNIIMNGETFSRSNIYKGFTANINIAAFSLVVKSPAALYIIFKSKKLFYKILGGILIFMIVSCLTILLSRGALIAFAFITLLMIIYSLLKKVNKNILSSAVVVFSILISYLTFSNFIVNDQENLINERITSIQIDGQDQSINERLRFYKGAFESILENPILGVGVGNWKIESMKYDSKFVTGYRIPFHAHNDILQVAAESGLLASFFFLLFLVYPFYVFIKLKVYMIRDIKFYCILLMMTVYIIDTLINFPISRPVSHIFLIFISITLMFLANKYEKTNN